ncbi:MAG: heavy metal translocating P-type ATPase, partial [Sinobacterium sp.]|nr:heavy metal translocating P-type ATPase [Sinobacterium sp.]
MHKETVVEQHCYHCDEQVFTQQQYQLTIKDEVASFCCPACLSITQTILDSGLGDYYQQRETAAATPSKGSYLIWDNTNLQQGFVSTSNNVDSSSPKNIVNAKLYIEGMHCSTCAWLIEKTLERQTSVKRAHVDYSQESLTVEWNIGQTPLSSIMTCINNTGYTPHPFQEDTIKKLQENTEKKMLKRLGILGLLMMQIGMLSTALYAGNILGISAEYENLLRTFTLLLSLPVLFYGALPFLSRAFLSLETRQLGMDFNISIAIIGLFASSVYAVIYQQGEIYFDSVAMLCFFILLARFIEHKSRIRLRNHSAFLPTFAHKIVKQKVEDTPLNDINIGDTIRVKQGETIPADGKIQSGQSTVSESILTGESKAITKTKGDKVLAGCQNHDGEIDIIVEKPSKDSLAKNIERFLQRPDNNKTTSVSLTNQLAHHFSELIIFLSVASFAFWYYIGDPDAYWIALSVLVVSCPCALSLASPTALSAIQATLRKQGILIQNDSTIENLKNISHVIFDKTGTLTSGEFKISHHKNLSSYTTEKLINIAARLEASSKHPISRAFKTTSNIALNTHVFLHLGVEGEVDTKRYRIGSELFCQQWHPNAQSPDLPEQHNLTQAQWIGLCNNEAVLAWFLLEDNLREQAESSISYLKSQDFSISMVSGDRQAQVKNTAEALGIKNIYAQKNSFEKLEVLKKIHQETPYTLTIGDGINDAPLLSESYISATFSNACDWVKNT